MTPYLPLALLLSLQVMPCAMAAESDQQPGATSGQATQAGDDQAGKQKPGVEKAEDEEDAEPDCD